MKKNRFIIIGLGNIGLILLKTLSRDYELLCIDKDESLIDRAKEIREDIEVIAGDATSRLVLEEAGVNDADGVIITTTDEKVNIEVARILHENFEPRRVIAIAISEEGIETLQSYGAEVENIFMASAVGIVNRLTEKTKTTHEIGIGRNEIMEVEVHPNSRLANKPIGVLAPIKWRIGIIYRDENIIIPRRDVVLKPRDRVVILGDPNILKTVAEILTFSFERFPLEYGTVVLTYLTGAEDEKFFEELGYIISSFPVEKNIFVCSKKAAERKDEIELFCDTYHIKERVFKESILPILSAIEETTKEIKDEQALIVVSKKAALDSFRVSLFSAHKRNFLYSLVDTASCPVFLLSGTHPYTKILLPCFTDSDIERILETGIEVSSIINGNLTALTVEPSRYIATEEEHTKYKEIKKRISSLTAMYKTSIEVITKKGNPIKTTHQVQREYNLLVINRGSLRRGILSFLSPDVVWNIIKGTKITTLITPPVEETL
jgi:hypothetical protein